MHFVDQPVRPQPAQTGGWDGAPGLLTFDRADYQRANVLAPQDAHWQALQDSYAALPTDDYLPGGETYRLRRFGRYLYLANSQASGLTSSQAGGDSLTHLEHAPFYQSKDYNPLNGGIHRNFAPLAPATQTNPVLHRLIRFHVRHCTALYPGIRDWLIYVHQIRILGNGGSVGQPTPEGLHQDGHHVVAQILVARENVRGAESTVCDANRAPIYQTVLREALDTVVVDDRAVWHGVTPLQGIDPSRPAYRDMLLIDFNPVR